MLSTSLVYFTISWLILFWMGPPPLLQIILGHVLLSLSTERPQKSFHVSWVTSLTFHREHHRDGIAAACYVPCGWASLESAYQPIKEKPQGCCLWHSTSLASLPPHRPQMTSLLLRFEEPSCISSSNLSDTCTRHVFCTWSRWPPAKMPLLLRGPQWSWAYHLGYFKGYFPSKKPKETVLSLKTRLNVWK